jgi:putative transcriptional regulator
MSERFVLRNRVRELRARLNMRQADLAREVDVTRQTILAIEKGRLNPSILVSLKIARVLREPVGYVFYLDRASDTELTPEFGEEAVVDDAAEAVVVPFNFR